MNAVQIVAVIAGVWFIASGVLAYALCKTAARADEMEERDRREQQRRREQA
jgi:hypothetical protein